MKHLLLKPVTAAWLLLMLATSLSWWVGQDRFVSLIDDGNHLIISSGLVFIAFIKVRIVISYFMDVRHAPLVLKIACDSWVVLVGGAIILIMNGVIK